MFRHRFVTAAIVVLTVAAVFFSIMVFGRDECLVLRNTADGKTIAAFSLGEGDIFSIGFIHSVNKSPVTDFYQIEDNAIYVEKTVYYGFGAGVQTEIEPGQELTFGDDGSMIVSGFHQPMPDLTYFVGTVSDHILTLPGDNEVSLRDLCGKNTRVRFTYEKLWPWEKQ